MFGRLEIAIAEAIMFQRIGRGWEMAKASWSVVKLHPKLLLLPVFSGIAFLALIAVVCIGALTTFGGTIASSPGFTSLASVL